MKTNKISTSETKSHHKEAKKKQKPIDKKVQEIALPALEGKKEPPPLFFTEIFNTPIPNEIKDLLRSWHAIAETFPTNDSLQIISNILRDALMPPQYLGKCSIVAVRGGEPNQVQALAFVIEKQKPGVFADLPSTPVVKVENIATAPWNRPEGKKYAEDHQITPMRGAGTACIEACTRINPELKFQDVYLYLNNFKIGFMALRKLLGQTIVKRYIFLI